MKSSYIQWEKFTKTADAEHDFQILCVFDFKLTCVPHFKILSTTEDSYTFEYQLAVKDPYKKVRVEKGTAKKIK